MNVKSSNGGTALMAASQNGHVDVVRAPLNRGVEVNSKANDGGTALIAASQEGYPDIVRALLDKGADVNAGTALGQTALMAASAHGYSNVIQILLDKGANVNTERTDGVTALILASQSGHRDVVRFLLTRGADVNAKASNGATALILASQNGHIRVVQLLKAAIASADTSSTPPADVGACLTTLTVQLQTFGRGVKVELREGIPGNSKIVGSQPSSGGNVYFTNLCEGSYFMAIGNEDEVDVTPVRHFEGGAHYESKIIVQPGIGNVRRASRSAL